MRIPQLLVLASCVSLAPCTSSAQPVSVSNIQSQLEAVNADSQKIDLLVEIGQNALQKGKTDSARIYIERARQLADSLNFGYGRQQALLGLGDFYLVQQKFDSAETVLSRAMQITPHPPLLLKIQNLLATAHRYQGNNQQAIQIYRDLLANIDSTAQPRTAAGIAQNLADAYINVGNSAQAFKHYSKAVAYGEEAQDSLFLATALNNLGNAYNGGNKFENAGRYLERSLEISRAIDFAPGELRSLLNLGNTRSSQGRFKEAESLYKQALVLSGKVRPDSPPVQIQYNLGELYYRMEKLQEAETYFQQSLENSERSGQTQGIYYNAAGLGNVAEQRGNMQEAIRWHSRALDIAEELQNPSLMQTRHQRLYELNKQRDSLHQALLHLEQSKVLSDSLMTTEQNRMAAEYQTKLELQQHEQQNRELEAESERQASQLEVQNWLIEAGLLVIMIIGVFVALLYRANRKNREINQNLEVRKQELEKANELKNKLFSIVAHDLRSPLGAIIGMLELFRDDDLTAEEIRSLSAELELSLRHNVNIMENLLSWAKQQMSGLSVVREELGPQGVAEEIIQAYKYDAKRKQLTLKNNISRELKVYADYDMLKLVMRNLVSNGIKFSEQGGEVSVDATRSNGEVLFEVQDSGIGIPEEIQQNIFETTIESRSGTLNERGSGIGLHLCKQFIEEQAGEIGFESKEGTGSRFYFTLPATI